MIETFRAELPHGITLSCRAAGRPGAPLLVFLHGFPEAAFVWDKLLEHFADRYRCVAPNLRGFADSSSPVEVEAYRPKHLIADIDALIAQQGGGHAAAVVAHDWGGAVAWGYAAQHAARLDHLVIINSPHPATFLRELLGNPAQQAASAYMNFLCRPDAEALLAANDFGRLWPMFEGMGAADANHPGGGWMDAATRDRYREVWRAGLTGACNYYRVSPLKPALTPDAPITKVAFKPEQVTVQVPTLVVWGEADLALQPALLDGLEVYVPRMHLVRVPEATHWIIHERPQWLAAQIEGELARQTTT